MTIAAGITDARDIFIPLLSVAGPVLIIAALAAAVAVQWGRIFRKLRTRWENRRARREYDEWCEMVTDVREISDEEKADAAAELDAETIADLDAWEADILADPLPELDAVPPTAPAPAHREPAAAGTAVVGVPWPQPLHPRLTDYAVSAPAQCPLPARWDPLKLTAQTYANRAAEFAHDMRDGVEVYDEDTYAEGVIRRMRSYVDAPVSPAPWMPAEHRPRHALNSAPGTATQRALWEHDTGAWPVVRELTGVGA